MTREEKKAFLLSDPLRLLKKKPFTRGAEPPRFSNYKKTAYMTERVDARLPTTKLKIVSQEQFMRELDPNCHDVLFDDNIPSICVKLEDGGYREIKYEKMAIPFQKKILNKQVLHLTGNKMQFTLVGMNPEKKVEENFTTFKEYWDARNQDGMKTKMVSTQLSLGDAALLYYWDHEGRIKSRLFSYADGYVICSHKDDNGDTLLECLYYESDGVEYIDCYDDTFFYRFENDGLIDGDNDSGWIMSEKSPHHFNECPLITKRGDVAWNDAQNIISSYESLYNVFNAIQKRFGWGIFYVKGKFKNNAQKIAGSVVLNDTSLDGNGDAKFLTPPTPQGMIETLDNLIESIQRASSTTFILPKDVKSAGDISALAIMLTQSMDIENALQKCIEWQNVADKMARLFKHGLSVELVNKGINPQAITEFQKLEVSAKFKPWRPMNEYEFNQMVSMMTSAGLLSIESGIELNTLSKPNEKARVGSEQEEKERREEEKMKMKMKDDELRMQQKKDEKQLNKV